MSRPHRMPPIAVTGVGSLFPNSAGPDAFWKTIVTGQDCMIDIPRTHWSIGDYYDPDPAVRGKTYARRGAFLPSVEFDSIEHGIPPNMLPATDTAQLLALLVAKQVLESSGALERVSKDRISVILGVASATELVSTMSGSLQRPVIEKALRESGLPKSQVDAICERFGDSYADWTESTFPGLLGNVVAGRIANRFDLGGTNCVVDAACASSFAAIKMAIDELWTGAADMVISGGVDAINDIFMFMCFSKTLAMSRSGDCRPFSDDADGTMLGEGIGMFALRRLEDAERDGDRIYAVLRGIGGSSDGRAKSIYAPRAEGQAKALRRAYQAAGYDPATVELMEAHGTGTTAGDAAEVTALTEIFRESRPHGEGWCALGSVKSQIGHTKAAAGAASLYKAVMALHHKALPPTIKVRRPNPALNLHDSPFYLNSETRPWIRDLDHPRRASVSSFGFGGSNFHLTLEEYQGTAPKPPRIRTIETELFLFSSDAPDDLRRDLLHVVDEAKHNFAAAACDSQKRFQARSQCRLAVVAHDSKDLAAKADAAFGAIDKGHETFWNPSGIAYGTGERPGGKVAFLFPGQGSQYVGMGAELALAFEDARRPWDSAPDLARLVFPPPVFDAQERTSQAERLTDTRHAQPAIGILNGIYLQLLRAAGIHPELCAGHSFGEVSALCCAGVVSAEASGKIARERGARMAEAAANIPGAMAAVAASETAVRELLPALGTDVVIANINSPQQVVIAGLKDQVELAIKRLSESGFVARLLPVATAFHSPIVEPASFPFGKFLETVDFGSPQIPVYSNTTSQPYPGNSPDARALLTAQMVKPVRFADEVSALYEAGARIYIEVGPGSVLTDLVSSCLQGRKFVAVPLNTKGKNAVTGVWLALARLAAAGLPLDMSFAWKEYSVAQQRKPATSAATVSLCGTNFGKKYPGDVANSELTVENVPAVVHDDDRSSSIRLIQEKMAEAHTAAQRALTESHLAFLKASEAALARLLPGVPAAETPQSFVQESVKPPLIEQVLLPTVNAPPEKPTPIGAEAMLELVLTIIAEETGYPADILKPEMELEADLGIDSIKRVQILSAIAEKRPDLPSVEASSLGSLRTIGAIAAMLEGSVPHGVPSASIDRIGVKEVEAPAYGPAKSIFSESARLAVVGCNDGIGVSLARRLQNDGVSAAVSFEIPSDATDTVYLDFDEAGRQDIVEHAYRIFSAARGFAQSRGAQGGSFVIAHANGSAWHSGISGIAKTLALEYPQCSVRSIEIATGARAPQEIAEMVWRELVSGTAVDAVSLDADGRRIVMQEVERPITQGAADYLADKPVILASGGARGITAACLVALAKTAPVRLALIGRSQVISDPEGFGGFKTAAEIKAALLHDARLQGEQMTPKQLESQARRILASREIRNTLEALRECGSEASYWSVDIRDAEATKTVIEEVHQRWGRINMLIHGAGTIADKRIVDKSREQFSHVFGTKVLGLRSLLQATAEDPLRFIGLFSSVAGRYGNAGQADYAMANAAMNKIAREEASGRGPQCIVRSMNWGPWDSGMVTPELREHFTARGISLIGRDEGAAAFVREIQHGSHDPADVDVVLIARSSSSISP